MKKSIAHPAAVLLYFCLIITACGKEALTEITPPPPAPIQDTTFAMDNPVNQALLLEMVNDIRSKGCQCGDTFMGAVPAIKWNRTLERAAYLHSKDMNTNNYFAHEDRSGNNAGYRITSMGYTWQSWGENIALGILTEKTVVKGWFGSPVHCKVLMTRNFTEMGIAKVGNFWSQAMAVPKAAK